MPVGGIDLPTLGIPCMLLKISLRKIFCAGCGVTPAHEELGLVACCVWKGQHLAREHRPHAHVLAPFLGQVRASHLLIKHSGSRRPASWKDPEGKEITKRSKEAAKQILLALREAIASGQQDFAEAARHESDCSSASRGGDLGTHALGASWQCESCAPHCGECVNISPSL